MAEKDQSGELLEGSLCVILLSCYHSIEMAREGRLPRIAGIKFAVINMQESNFLE